MVEFLRKKSNMGEPGTRSADKERSSGDWWSFGERDGSLNLLKVDANNVSSNIKRGDDPADGSASSCPDPADKVRGSGSMAVVEVGATATAGAPRGPGASGSQ